MEKSSKQAINEFFEFVTTCTDHSPDEDKCHQLLDGLLSITKLIKNSIVADNFEGRWIEAKGKIKPYADPATFRFHELEIEKNLNKILAPARAEL